jgi:hypothetical protein
MTSKLSLGALTFSSAGIITAYICKQWLDHSYPRISISKVSRLSACRQLVDKACDSASDTDMPKAWGADNAGLLSSWSEANSGDRKDRWLSSYVAVQLDVPLALLASYTSEPNQAKPNKCDNKTHTTDDMTRNLIKAFLEARSNGPDGWLIDRNVPAVAFTPGSHLFGDSDGLSAFMFGSWSSRSNISIHPSGLPKEAPLPSSFFPSNEELIASQGSSLPESTGTVIYWRVPSGWTNTLNHVAAYGWPWRLMDGGFQEFIVERISDETVRVTYITVECSDLRPSDQATNDFKRPPWLLYEAHVLYAQSLLFRTVQQLKKTHSTSKC